VPPSIRNRGAGGGEGESMRRREENSVRVTNLSEDTREDDLRVRTFPWGMYAKGKFAMYVCDVCIGADPRAVKESKALLIAGVVS
jgi:hypothetical protein